MKQCTKCKVKKELAAFYKSTKAKTGLCSSCKECHNIANKNWRNKSQNYIKEYKKKKLLSDPDWLKRNKLWFRYGLTLEDYNKRLNDQNNSCAICLSPFDLSSKGTSPCVDHCHVTLYTRNILCFNCNVLLGVSKENTAILGRAIAYLNKYALAKKEL